MKSLVLGGSGFVGRAVARALARRGPVVATYHRLRPAYRIRGVRWIPYSRAATPDRFDLVVWAVWDGTRRSTPLLERYLDRAASGRRAATNSRVVRFALLSSASAKARRPSPYGALKRGEEKILRRTARAAGVTPIVLRLHNLLGPGARANNLPCEVARRIAAARRTKAPIVVRVGSLSARRDYLDLRDAAEAISAAVRRASAGTYDVASGRAVSVGRILDMIARRVARETGRSVAYRAAPGRDRGMARSVGNPAPLARATGWLPRRGLMEAIDEILRGEGAISG